MTLGRMHLLQSHCPWGLVQYPKLLAKRRKIDRVVAAGGLFTTGVNNTPDISRRIQIVSSERDLSI